MGLRGKVKTMDIYYFYPESEESLFSISFKKGEKQDYKGKHHITFTFSEKGQLLEYIESDKNNNYIASCRYIYAEDKVLAKIDSFAFSMPDTPIRVVYKFEKRGQLLETIYKYPNGIEETVDLNTYDDEGRLLKSIDRKTGSGEINDYDERGNLIRKELLTNIKSHAFALTEYDYNDRNLLTEASEYYNKIELYRKYVYLYGDNDLLQDLKIYGYSFLRPFIENHYTYKYDDQKRLLAKYEINKDSTIYPIDEYEYRYYPDSVLQYIIKNNSIEAEYDKDGKLRVHKADVPGFEIISDDDEYKYKLDRFGNWLEVKDFDGYVELGMYEPSGLIQITAPYVERHFSYYDE